VVQDQTIYLHIGRGKTGTTALRRHFAKHTETLARHGICYPMAAGAAQGYGHDTFGKAFITERPFYMKPPHNAKQELQALAEEIRATDLPKILLLSEQLEMADPVRVRQFLDSLGKRFEYRIVFFLRSQDELVESEFNQLVRFSSKAGALAEYANTLFNGDFHATATAWADVFGQGALSCPVYDARSPRVLAQLMQALGAEAALADLPELPVSNRSVSFQALTAIRLLYHIDLADRAALHRQILDGPVAAHLPALYFDARDAAAFRARYGASNRALARFMGHETEDLGGRRYIDTERDEIRRAILDLRLDRF